MANFEAAYEEPPLLPGIYVSVAYTQHLQRSLPSLDAIDPTPIGLRLVSNLVSCYQCLVRVTYDAPATALLDHFSCGMLEAQHDTPRVDRQMLIPVFHGQVYKRDLSQYPRVGNHLPVASQCGHIIPKASS